VATQTIPDAEPATAARKGSRRLMWLSLAILLLIAFVVVFIPAWVIQPFKSQTYTGMKLSFVLRRWSPIVTPICLAGMATLVVLLWRGSRWWRRIVLVLIVGVASVFTWFSRQNHFEWIFNPLPQPGYSEAAEETFLEDGDMVLAVENNGYRAAYPVRLMAYHHVVQDVVGGTPIVATY
jgi:hypothetical protein